MFEVSQFLRALKWTYVGSVGDLGLSAIFSLILASILGPRIFGIFSLAMIYIGFLKMFLDQGLGAALIQRKELEQEHLDAAFWVNIGESNPPINCQTIAQLMSRMPDSRALVQFGPIRYGHC